MNEERSGTASMAGGSLLAGAATGKRDAAARNAGRFAPDGRTGIGSGWGKPSGKNGSLGFIDDMTAGFLGASQENSMRGPPW